MKYIAFVVCILLSGCYSQKKASNQLAKAVIAYPKIGAEYCSNNFKPKDSVITDTLLTTDTLLLPGNDIVDTVFSVDRDTVRIIVTKTLPAKVITNTVTIRDTIYQTNTAALKSCEIDKSALIALTTKQAADIDKYKAKANKRGWMFWGLVFLVVGYVGGRVYLKSKGIKI